MKHINVKKLITTNLPYLMIAWLFNKVSEGFRIADGIDITEKIMSFPASVVNAFQNLMPSMHIMDILIGIGGAIVIRLAVYTNAKITALYERLSKDDEQKSESVSIAHQKQMLESSAQKNGFHNTRHFFDDGVTYINLIAVVIPKDYCRISKPVFKAVEMVVFPPREILVTLIKGFFIMQTLYLFVFISFLLQRKPNTSIT